jgi:hypothetical protein
MTTEATSTAFRFCGEQEPMTREDLLKFYIALGCGYPGTILDIRDLALREAAEKSPEYLAHLKVLAAYLASRCSTRKLADMLYEDLDARNNGRFRAFVVPFASARYAAFVGPKVSQAARAILRDRSLYRLAAVVVATKCEEAMEAGVFPDEEWNCHAEA